MFTPNQSQTMTNNVLIALADIGILLILLLIASFITGAILFVSEAIRRPFLRKGHSSSNPIASH
jgi:hypothetical protein